MEDYYIERDVRNDPKKSKVVYPCIGGQELHYFSKYHVSKLSVYLSTGMSTITFFLSLISLPPYHISMHIHVYVMLPLQSVSRAVRHQ